MTLTQTGSTMKFAEGWQKIFGSGTRGKSAASKPAKTRPAKTKRKTGKK